MTTCTYCGKEDFEHGVGLDCAGFKSAFPTNSAEAKVKAVYPHAHQRRGWIYNLPFGPGCHQIGRSWHDAALKLSTSNHMGNANEMVAEPSPTAGTPEGKSLRVRIESNITATGDWRGRKPEELERLRAEPATPQAELSDGLDILANQLYGRKAVPRDYIGGSNARIFHEAKAEILIHKAELAAALTREREKDAEIERLKSLWDFQVDKTVELSKQIYALQVSHDALLRHLGNYPLFPTRPWREKLTELIAAAEKLTGRKGC